MALNTNGNSGTSKYTNIQEFGREIYHQADNTRRDVVKQLFDVAENIRTRAKGIEGEARDTAERIAHNMEQTANYLNGRAIDQMEDTTETMREHIWETTLVAFIVGLVIGLLIGCFDHD